MCYILIKGEERRAEANRIYISYSAIKISNTEKEALRKKKLQALLRNTSKYLHYMIIAYRFSYQLISPFSNCRDNIARERKREAIY